MLPGIFKLLGQGGMTLHYGTVQFTSRDVPRMGYSGFLRYSDRGGVLLCTMVL